MNSKEMITDKLSKRDLKFIQYRMQGLKVKDAYHLSGFKGSDQAAYILSHRLNGRITSLIEQGFFNRTELMTEIQKLISLPLRDDQKAMTIDQKIKALRLFKEALPDTETKQSFTQFNIINGRVPEKQVVVDVLQTTVVPEQKPEAQ